MIFVDYASGSTLDVTEHPSVDHYLSTIRGRAFTYGEDDRKRTIGRNRSWTLPPDLMERDWQDPWEVMVRRMRNWRRCIRPCSTCR